MKVVILSQNDVKIKNEVKKRAKKLINQVAKNKKTKQEIIEACFDYIRKNITYNGQHQGDKDNYYIDALTGLKTWHGDCLVSNGVLRIICEELDVPIIVVERSSKERSHHYWLLIDTGDGWYHYDAFNQYNRIYKWTDQKLISWSKANNNYQEFDTSLYPSTPKQ